MTIFNSYVKLPEGKFEIRQTCYDMLWPNPVFFVAVWAIIFCSLDHPPQFLLDDSQFSVVDSLAEFIIVCFHPIEPFESWTHVKNLRALI